MLDPYSGYLTPDEYADMIEEATGKWSGLGVTFSVKDGEDNEQLLVTRVSGNSPAEAAGILPGMAVVGFGVTESEIAESVSYEELSVFLKERAEGEKFILKMTGQRAGKLFIKRWPRKPLSKTMCFTVPAPLLISLRAKTPRY